MAILSTTFHLSRATTLPVLAVICLGTCFLAICVYNVFFHPLRNVPGPRLARFSKAWSRYGNLKGQKSHRIHAAHRTYGKSIAMSPTQLLTDSMLVCSTIRVAPNELSFADPQAVRDIYSSDAFVKEEAFYVRPLFSNDVLTRSNRMLIPFEASKTSVPRGDANELPVCSRPSLL